MLGVSSINNTMFVNLEAGIITVVLIWYFASFSMFLFSFFFSYILIAWTFHICQHFCLSHKQILHNRTSILPPFTYWSSHYLGSRTVVLNLVSRVHGPANGLTDSLKKLCRFYLFPVLRLERGPWLKKKKLAVAGLAVYLHDQGK